MGLINRLLSTLKGESYSLHEELDFLDWISWIYRRYKQFIRAKMLFVLYPKINPRFVGINTSLLARHSILIESGVTIGDFVKIDGFAKEGVVIGFGTTIADGSIIVGSGVMNHKGVGVRIGSNCSVGAGSFIGGQGGVLIEDNVIMGPGVKIFSENHNYLGSDVIRRLGVTRTPVKIESDCWIGANVTILAGVHISSRTIVAAGAVVTKSFGGNCVVGGVPAKIISELT